MSGTNGHNHKANGKQGKSRVGKGKPPVEHQFRAGVSGNPKGRPKGSVDIWARVRRKLRQKVAKGPKAGERYADLVAAAIVKAAVKGRWPATKELLDREHGKPAESVAHTGGVEVKVVYVPVANGRLANAERN